MKAHALAGRDKPKDAYDICYCLIYFPGGLRLLGRAWRKILPGDQVRDLATQLLDKHPLRAADGLQLAAAMVWCGQRPLRRSFVCGDQRLAKAAQSAGFSVLDLSRMAP